MTKVNKFSRNVAIASLLAPVGVNALGVGEIQLHSALNQNFLAEIPIHVSPGEVTENINVKLASPAAFEKAGVERNYLLSALKFKPELNADGTMSVKVRSNDAIREPFLNFLIEVNWSEGKMLKEYTVLLDPPNTVAQAVVPSPVTTQSRSSVSRSRQNSRVQPPSQAVVAGPSSSSNAGASRNGFQVVTDYDDSVVVPKGSALWKIADKMRDQVGVSREKMMMALFKANPEAFYNKNINALKAGARLKFPSPEELDSLNQQQSLKAVKQHQSKWNKTILADSAKQSGSNAKTAKQGKLRIEPSNSSKSNGQDQALLERLETLLTQIDVMSEENVSLKSQVSELQERIKELSTETGESAKPSVASEDQAAEQSDTSRQGVAVDSNARITQAAVTDQTTDAATSQTTTDTVDSAATPAQPSETPDVATNEQKAGTEQATQKQQLADKQTQSTPSVEQKPVVKKPVQTTDSSSSAESGFVSDILSSPWAIGSIIGALALSALGLLAFKRRKQALMEEMEAYDSDKELDVQQSDGQQIATDDDGSADQKAQKQDSELGDSVFFSEYRPTEANVDSQAMEVDHDDLDPISEADVYVAYGRYQQAEELIQQALQDYPERDEFKLKLLEIYHAKDDSAGFAAYVTELKTEGAVTSTEFWNKAQEIGQGFAPDNLFGETFANEEDLQVDQFSSELFGVDSDSQALELNDHLTEIVESNSSVQLSELDEFQTEEMQTEELQSDEFQTDEFQSIDLNDAGETVEQLETAFSLDGSGSESVGAQDDAETEQASDGFTVNLNNLENVDTLMVDSENHINSVLVNDAEHSDSMISSDETEAQNDESVIDFESALSKSLDVDSGIRSSDDSGMDQSESFEFDSEAVDTSSWDLDIESVNNLDLQTDSEMAIDTSEFTALGSEAIDTNEFSVLDSDPLETAEMTELMEPVSSLADSVDETVGLEDITNMETRDSIGLVSSESDDTDAIDLQMNDGDSPDQADISFQFDEVATDIDSEQLQEIADTVMDAEAGDSESDNESTMFQFDDISSELVESAQISEILDEVSQRNTDFAEESVISEMFEPASVFQESELFESELSDLDEVADKLDLAKAYIDMEDGESARGILQEVIETGNEDQKELAKSMVQALEKSA
ncbi:MAG: hypothetical protein K0U68_08230 [Gammaproteobacteria bacterium]|nr:hypothetical protein [Gammaproteobacteria bacterium]